MGDVSVRLRDVRRWGVCMWDVGAWDACGRGDGFGWEIRGQGHPCGGPRLGWIARWGHRDRVGQVRGRRRHRGHGAVGIGRRANGHRYVTGGRQFVGDPTYLGTILCGHRHLAMVQADENTEQSAIWTQDRRREIAAHPQQTMLRGVGRGMPGTNPGRRRGGTVEHAGDDTVGAGIVGSHLETGEGSRQPEIAHGRRRNHDETGCLHLVAGMNRP